MSEPMTGRQGDEAWTTWPCQLQMHNSPDYHY